MGFFGSDKPLTLHNQPPDGQRYHYDVIPNYIPD